MRKLYYVACTVDRFIARTDGSFDFFLQDGEHFADLVTSFPETFPAPACCATIRNVGAGPHRRILPLGRALPHE